MLRLALPCITCPRPFCARTQAICTGLERCLPSPRGRLLCGRGQLSGETSRDSLGLCRTELSSFEGTGLCTGTGLGAAFDAAARRRAAHFCYDTSARGRSWRRCPRAPGTELAHICSSRVRAGAKRQLFGVFGAGPTRPLGLLSFCSSAMGSHMRARERVREGTCFGAAFTLRMVIALAALYS